MKRRGVKRTLDGSNSRSTRRKRRECGKMKGTLTTTQEPFRSTSASSHLTSSLFLENLLDSEDIDDKEQSSDPQQLRFVTEAEGRGVIASVGNGAGDVDEKDFILSQDFFCTPDYITPDDRNLLNGFDCNKENIPCPRSPEKLNTVKTKKLRQVLSPTLSDQQPFVDLEKDIPDSEEVIHVAETENQKPRNYLSQSAISLRCRVMPPPCIKNSYLIDASEADIDPFGYQRSKCAGFFPEIAGGNGLSRYHTDFHEVQRIGTGNFSCVFKVLKRIDGCFYAVKHSTRQLHLDTERQKALMEVQALAALGCHENIVGYYSSWFENEQLYIQMELCDCNLSTARSSKSFTEGEVLEVLNQMAKALLFIHERGIAHLDIKPDNIYVKNEVFKLGDFGCATRLDQSLLIEEGDARYMPQEILNENYNHLDKVDVFSLGAAIYELVRGSPLPESGSQIFNLRDGKLPLLPGHSVQFQNLLKAMLDPDPVRRPSAKELLKNPIFDKIQRNRRT